jgi:hypothetical protein
MRLIIAISDECNAYVMLNRQCLPVLEGGIKGGVENTTTPKHVK